MDFVKGDSYKLQQLNNQFIDVIYTGLYGINYTDESFDIFSTEFCKIHVFEDDNLFYGVDWDSLKIRMTDTGFTATMRVGGSTPGWNLLIASDVHDFEKLKIYNRCCVSGGYAPATGQWL